MYTYGCVRVGVYVRAHLMINVLHSEQHRGTRSHSMQLLRVNAREDRGSRIRHTLTIARFNAMIN